MAAEAEAAREARAKVSVGLIFHISWWSNIFEKVIAAEGEQKASRALREASNTIAESSSALQLRYLQVRNNSSSLVSIHGVLDSKLNISREKFYDNISDTSWHHVTVCQVTMSSSQFRHFPLSGTNLMI